LFTATNTFTVTSNGAETLTNYYNVRKFDNGTVWWTMYVCTTNGVVGAGQIDCSSSSPNYKNPLQKATQIAWYETLLAGTPGQMRTVYYVNGTVSQETWTWDATLLRVQTVTKVIIAQAAFVNYVSTTSGSVYPWTVTAWTASPTTIVEERKYSGTVAVANTSDFFYFKRVEDDSSLSVPTGQSY
jgi:hypothetical protein